MDPMNDHMSQVCKRHNQPIVFYEQVNNKPSCLVCIQEKTGMNPDEAYQYKIEENIQKAKLDLINNKELYQNLYNSILNYKSSLVQSLDKILQNIQNQIKLIDINQQQFFKYQEQNKERRIEDLEKQSQQQQQFNDQFKKQIKLYLDELQRNIFLLPSNQLQVLIQNNIFKSEQILGWNKIKSEIIKESYMKESKECYAFGFNKENTILVVACQKEIILYQFINGVIAQELQRLTDHTGCIFCLYFMQKSNSFVSGSSDKLIIIWEFDNNKNKWFAKQKLQEHTYWANFIAMNANEDLLISGSQDQTIKFWKKNKNNWSCSQTIKMKDQVFAISLNEMENKLISSGFECFLSIMEKQNDDQWRIVQTINMSNGWRLCFTDGDQFFFQPKIGDQLEVYNYDKGKKEFQISQKVQINQQRDDTGLFPCQYIKQLKMLSVKHGKYLNLFKINQTGDYQLIQSIEFQSEILFGRVTDNGQNLITWDKVYNLIQVRQLKFLE